MSYSNICNWANKWLLTLSIDKYLYLQLGYSDQSITYTSNHHVLKPTTVAKDFGSTQQTNLKSGLHCTDIARKACARANLIIISSLSRDAKNFTRAFSAYFRPILEYCTPVWNPRNIYDIDILSKLCSAPLHAVFSIYVTFFLPHMTSA